MRRLMTLALVGSALSGSAQTTRTVQSTLLWPELQGELALKNGDYLLLALRGERTTADGYAQRTLGFDTRRATVAYEHFWDANWSWGGTARYEWRSSSYDLLVPELLVRHRAPIFGGITFGQRLSAEYIIPANTNYLGGSGPKSQFWGRLRVDLEKVIALGGDATTGLALRPRLSYEASTHLRLQKTDNDLDERTIQFTSLRAEVGARVSPHFDFTPWFAYQTNYLVTLPQYDKNGVQTAGGNLNLVYPTVGLDLRYTILPAGGKATRQQLPTQH
ncbi:hypothetical protein GO988_18005 [Hymenobacter sp. HMF4947]|uniref:DUF481 domain-containing protein n=1 Tax=Hymenobacter ginkgonis TaxID=2682976 RepID=A0A7K1TIJ6_9BACT|nr:hypothetical protein [Hymenobacter ginkgonis]MVN78227.1 hypothetical protein [Hymenobacter ginkgonis]